MINNRQGGRRRGRGGQRPPSVSGQSGNRQDNRQRGNAAQLLEKYKNMARDAQLGGDRVQSEYFLQFADHYFRVLGESRSRYDEQRRQRGDDGSDEDGDEEMMDAGDDQQQQREPQAREPREPREPREQQQREQQQREQRPPRARRSESRSNGSQPDFDNDDEERISVEVLPPSIARDDFGGDETQEPVAKPKRRTRRPKAEDSEDEIAPAA